MFARALVVLLLMLNLGVALWWLARPPPVDVPSAPLPAGVVRLQLLQEAPARAAPAASGDLPATGDNPAAAGNTVAAAEPVAAAAARCFRLGPFAEAADAARASARLLGSGVTSARPRAVAAGVRGWNVSMLPLADRAAAEAMAARIRAAGFDDLFILASGESANGIALGRYGNEAAARRRVAELRAAGFEASAQAIGDAQPRHWVDVAAAADFDIAAAQRASGAVQAEPVDCPAPG